MNNNLTMTSTGDEIKIVIDTEDIDLTAKILKTYSDYDKSYVFSNCSTENCFIAPRQSGKTAWLIEKIIKDPHAIMVVQNTDQLNRVRERILAMPHSKFRTYIKMLYKDPTERILTYFDVKDAGEMVLVLNKRGMRKEDYKFFIDDIEFFSHNYPGSDLHYTGFTSGVLKNWKQ